MVILKNIDDLKKFLRTINCEVGCLADTGFLYGLAYEDDRLFSEANDVHELLAESRVPIYSNVISRLELIDLIFRKQVTSGCLQIFNGMKSAVQYSKMFNDLKYIRDKDTEARRKHESYKVDERRLKSIRRNINSVSGIGGWRGFCFRYIGSMLENEWTILEQEFGLNFIEVMEGQISPLFNFPLYWKDMVQVMAETGQRGPDAMIINLFAKSRFQLLITSDSDFEYSFSDSSFSKNEKAVFLLQ